MNGSMYGYGANNGVQPGFDSYGMPINQGGMNYQQQTYPYQQPYQPDGYAGNTMLPFQQSQPATQFNNGFGYASQPTGSVADYGQQQQQMYGYNGMMPQTMNNTGFMQPQQTGAIPGFAPQPTGFVQPQPTGFMSQQPASFMQPQRTGAFAQQTGGFMQPQRTGGAGFIQPQRTGAMPAYQPQMNNFMQPQKTGGFAPQATGFMQTQPFGAAPTFAPQPTGFVQPQQTGVVMPPQPTGYLQAQPTGPFASFVQPQQTASFMPAAQPLKPQKTGQIHNSKAMDTRLSFVSAADQAKFEQLFKSAVGREEAMSSEIGKAILVRSKLPTVQLSKIWRLSDTTRSGRLLFPQFVLAMYLCNLGLTGKPIPDKVPDGILNEVNAMVDAISFSLDENYAKPTQPIPQAAAQQMAAQMFGGFQQAAGIPSQITGFQPQAMMPQRTGMQPQMTGFQQPMMPQRTGMQPQMTGFQQPMIPQRTGMQPQMTGFQQPMMPQRTGLQPQMTGFQQPMVPQRTGMQPMMPGLQQPMAPQRTGMQPMMPQRTGMQPQMTGFQQPMAPQRTGMQPMMPQRTGMQPQMPGMQQPMAPQRTGMQPMMPQRTGMQPQMPGMQQPMAPQRTGMQPMAPQRTGMQPMMPQRTGMQPQMPGMQQPMAPQRTGMQPMMPQRTGMQPQMPSMQQPMAPQRTGMQPMAPQRTGMQPQMTGGPMLPQRTGGMAPQPTGMPGQWGFINTPLSNLPGIEALGQQMMPNAPSGGLNNTFQQKKDIPWAISKEEKRIYDQIFDAWDKERKGTLGGNAVLEIFGQSKLTRTELEHIWNLCDHGDKGSLDRDEFAVALHLIYRKLNGNEVPAVLPPELIPPSTRNFTESLNQVKNLIKNDTSNRKPFGAENQSKLKKNSFYDNPSETTEKDATLYRHNDSDASAYVSSARRRDFKEEKIESAPPTINDIDSEIASLKKRIHEKSLVVNALEDKKLAATPANDVQNDSLIYRIKSVQDEINRLSTSNKSPEVASMNVRLEELSTRVSKMLSDINEVDHTIASLSLKLFQAEDTKNSYDQTSPEATQERNRTISSKLAEMEKQKNESKAALEQMKNYVTNIENNVRAKLLPSAANDDAWLSQNAVDESVKRVVKELPVPAPAAPQTLNPPSVSTVQQSKPIESNTHTPEVKATSESPSASSNLEDRAARIKAEAQRRMNERLAALGIKPRQKGTPSPAPVNSATSTPVAAPTAQQIQPGKQASAVSSNVPAVSASISTPPAVVLTVQHPQPTKQIPSAAVKDPSTTSTSFNTAPIPQQAPLENQFSKMSLEPPVRPAVPTSPKPQIPDSLNVHAPLPPVQPMNAMPSHNAVNARPSAPERRDSFGSVSSGSNVSSIEDETSTMPLKASQPTNSGAPSNHAPQVVPPAPMHAVAPVQPKAPGMVTNAPAPSSAPAPPAPVSQLPPAVPNVPVPSMIPSVAQQPPSSVAPATAPSSTLPPSQSSFAHVPSPAPPAPQHPSAAALSSAPADNSMPHRSSPYAPQEPVQKPQAINNIAPATNLGTSQSFSPRMGPVNNSGSPLAMNAAGQPSLAAPAVPSAPSNHFNPFAKMQPPAPSPLQPSGHDSDNWSQHGDEEEEDSEDDIRSSKDAAALAAKLFGGMAPAHPVSTPPVRPQSAAPPQMSAPTPPPPPMSVPPPPSAPPMPAGPPSAPPPPLPASSAPSVPNPGDRSALLQQIHTGTRLKKTVTTDKSKPIAGRVLDASDGNSSAWYGNLS
ncbi:Actin cytoskeleton-regulatory complex protein pan1 [Schizosaccharomyces pombe]